MDDRDRDRERPYYGPARTAGGLFCLIVGALYVLFPPLVGGHDPDPIVLGILAATGALLLGVEGASRLLDR